jgi:hypothetical protein
VGVAEPAQRVRALEARRRAGDRSREHDRPHERRDRFRADHAAPRRRAGRAPDRRRSGDEPDVHGNPTFTDDLAEAIKRLVVGRFPGTFHVTNSGSATWFDLARATFEEAGLDPARVTPITTAEYPTPARRPAYAVLDNAALRLQGLPLLPDWRESLGRLVKELTS